jgi:hypothetical protein
LSRIPDSEQYTEQVLDQCEKECEKVCAQEYGNPVTRRLCADMCLLECHRQTQEI